MSHAPSRPVQAVFTTGPLMRHVAVMTATGSIGLMAVFVVDLLSLLYVSWLGRPEATAGVGFATIEQVVMKNGAMANAQLTNYTIPTTLDTPEMDVVLMENPFPEGPFGAKGLGELPIDGPAPAIVNGSS